MMAEQGIRVTLRVHGLDEVQSLVSAAVFARKLAALVSGLEAADRVVNQGRRHDFFITDLRPESATAELREMVVSKRMPERSSIAAYGKCVHAVESGEYELARTFDGCVNSLKRMADGVGEKFSHADLIVDTYDPVRVDDFFADQVEKALSEEPAADANFSGESFVSFDGDLKEVDLRGDVPRLKLILTAGRKQIDCVYPKADIEDIRRLLNNRVVVEGYGFFDGSGGLPVRLRIHSMSLVQQKGDLSRWRGSFEPFDLEEWETV